MKKPGTAVLLVLAPALAFAQDYPEVKERGALRVASVNIQSDDELWSENSQRLGLEREVLEKFCSVSHLRMQIVPVKKWDDLVSTLVDGKADIIAGRFTITQKRRTAIDFTVPIFPTRLVLLSRKPHPVISTLDKVQGQKIATVKGTSMEEMLREADVPPVSIDSSFAPGTLMGALQAGRASIIALGVEQALPELDKDKDLQLGMFIGPSSGLAWGVRKNSPLLKGRLDSFLNAFQTSGEWHKLVVKYFGQNAPELLKRARGEK